MTKLVLSATVSLLICGLATSGQDQRTERDPSFWMKRKLTYSQSILNGLVTEDHEAIRKHAMSMKALNKIEYFVRRKPEGYRTQLKMFQYSVNELVRHAENENLDGATLAFTQLTLSCVNCHQQLRK